LRERNTERDKTFKKEIERKRMSGNMSNLC
jgi:hypothetical protein